MPFARIDDIDIDYRWRGPTPEEAPTLVLLHEGLGCHEFWRGWMDRLVESTGCGVLAYSRYGYGQSTPRREPRDADYMRPEGERILPALLAELGVREHLCIGHSDGASVALLYAATQPQGLAGIALEAPHVFVEEVCLKGIHEAVEIYHSTDLPKKLARYHGEHTDAVFSAWADTWLAPWFRDWNIEYRLPLIQCPVSVIQGEDDEYATIAQVQAVASGVSGRCETHMLPDCKHTPHRDQAETVQALLIEFIRDCFAPHQSRNLDDVTDNREPLQQLSDKT